MNSIFEKHRIPVLCVIVLALIIAAGAIAATCMEAKEVNAYAVSDTGGADGPEKTVTVTVSADGNEIKLMTAQTTVKEMLENHKIGLGKHDNVTPEKDTVVKNGMEIAVQRVDYEKVTETVEVPYKTETKGVDTLPQGTSKVVAKGVNGQDKVTYKIKYVDGVEASREEVARETVKAPVTEVIEKSTIGTIQGVEYSRKFVVRAYSYTGGGRTASGKPAAVGRIAVDPRVIPLGTRVYVEGYGFAEAADTGGNIKGNTIDVYYNSIGQCRQWGVRNVTIYILK